MPAESTLRERAKEAGAKDAAASGQKVKEAKQRRKKGSSLPKNLVYVGGVCGLLAAASKMGIFEKSEVALQKVIAGGDGGACERAIPGGTLELLCTHGARILAEFKPFEMPGSQGGSINGLSASRNIAEGEKIFTIPRPLVLHEDNINEDVRKGCDLECDNVATLTLGLAVEMRTPRPEFAAWMASLPSSVPNIASFNEHHLKVVQLRFGNAPITMMETRLKEATTVNEELGLNFTREELQHAYALVQSRGLGVIDGSKETHMLMQGLDLMNHATDRDAYQVSAPQCNEKECWSLATKKVAKGEQLFGFYGDWGNLDLLVRWGFTSGDNKYGPTLPSGSLNVSATEAAKAWLPDFGCSEASVRAGSVVQKGASPDGLAAISTEDMSMRCAFVAITFDSPEATKYGFASGAENCLHSSGEGCPQHPPEWRRGAAATHKAAQFACLRLAKRWKDDDLKEPLEAIGSADDPISRQMLASIGEEVRMLSACITHHGEMASQLGWVPGGL